MTCFVSIFMGLLYCTYVIIYFKIALTKRVFTEPLYFCHLCCPLQQLTLKHDFLVSVRLFIKDI